MACRYMESLKTFCLVYRVKWIDPLMAALALEVSGQTYAVRYF